MNADEDRLRRCDRCGAVAKYVATKSVNLKVLELRFCQHHGNEQRIALKSAGWGWGLALPTPAATAMSRPGWLSS